MTMFSLRCSNSSLKELCELEVLGICSPITIEDRQKSLDNNVKDFENILIIISYELELAWKRFILLAL